jgi:hypothetical protein
MRIRMLKSMSCAGETDRLVVFRLGRMQGVLGPGRVVTFPWIDSYKRVNVGASAFRYIYSICDQNNENMLTKICFNLAYKFNKFFRWNE